MLPENEEAGHSTRADRGPANQGVLLYGSSGETLADKKPTRQAAWAQRNPLKRWAHIATASAIRRGILVRQPCAVCGDERTDFHHPDHTQPLSGEWLCRAHHKQAEKRLKAGAG